MSRTLTPPHLIWDWNGTLLDDAALIADAMNEAYRAAGMAAIGFDRYRDSFSLSVTELIERTHGRVPDPETLEAMGARYHEHYRAHVPSCALAPDAVEALDLADSLGITQSLLSLHPEDALLDALAGHGLADRFVLVTGRTGDASGGKYRRLLDHLDALGHTPDRAVMIGDTVDDAEAARRAGARAVLHTGGVQSRPALAGTGFPVADSLRRAVDMAAAALDACLRP